METQRLLCLLLLAAACSSAHGQELNANESSARLPIGRYGAAAVYDGDDSIYILGGWTFPSILDDVLKYSISEDSVVQVSTLPATTAYGSAVYDDASGTVFFLGGWTGFEFTKKVYQFDPKTNATNLVGNLTFETYRPSIIKLSSKIYIIGGEKSENLVQCFDLSSLSDCGVTEIDTSFKSLSAVSLDNTAYVFGYANSSSSSPVYQIDLSTMTTSYSTEKALPQLDEYPSAVRSGSNAYIIGGHKRETNFPGRGIIKVDLLTQDVSFVPVNNFFSSPLSTYVSSPASVFVEKVNRIYTFGGYEDSQVFRTKIIYIDMSPLN